MASRLFIGIMSGTSMDGVDAVLAEAHDASLTLRASIALAYPADLAAACLALNQPGDDELHRAGLAGDAMARLYAEAVTHLLAAAKTAPGAVSAIGAHGQTVRHRPDAGYTWQLLNGALLAELTGIATICDFRSRDMAAGGQGAPLVPAFHAASFAVPQRRVILNLGGIANITVLPGDSAPVTGFDTGPANMLMDHWCAVTTGQPYDKGGALAASGTVNDDLLARMLQEPYFAAPPPKSTGRDLFGASWLQRHIDGCGLPEADIQATLLALSVESIARGIALAGDPPADVLVCGGGALNEALMAALARRLAPARVTTTKSAGMDPMAVEALAFAWLAQRCLDQAAGNLPAVTGARGPRVLGALYPA
ncbi:MAG: anhydro-N-acetylmuramic acid kinase [Hyphomicrobiales bacterium]|nr:anhydro-N-acetylmuramic acid kinase [Hyphomicrobiales bacterium]